MNRTDNCLLVAGKHPRFGGMKRKRDAKELNWTKRSIFFELEYWSSLELKHNMDVMHVKKMFVTVPCMNDKSKDTTNARVDLKDWGIQKELWLQERDNKIIKPHPKYSFTTDDRRRFCQFIKRVKLLTKVTDNDSNITGLKSHDCHIMMQRLLPVGVRGYVDANMSAPIIELCSFFKQVCARSLVVDDMRKATNQLVKILCNMELIFPPAFFDIMIHLVLHLSEEAILGGPVYMRWMYPFERYMKKLKNYVRNKAKPEGSIAEGYIADEALTFCSMYFEGVQTRFNLPDRNEDVVVPRRQLSVFESQCRATSKKNNHISRRRSSEFKSEMHENDAQNKFAAWFKDKICNSQLAESSECTEELFALAHVNGVRFVVHSRDIRRTTQNSGVAVPGTDGFMFYGQLEDIIEIRYLSGYSVVLFRCKWFNTDSRKKRCITKNNITSISVNSGWFKSDPYILAIQAKQVFYIEDPSENHSWRVVEDVNHRKIWDHPSFDEVNDIDVVHNNISSNFVLSAELDDMADIGLERVGQSSVVDDICTIHTADETDFINDEDEETDVEHLDNDDVDSDNDVVDGYYSSDEFTSPLRSYAAVARGHGGDAGGDPPLGPRRIPTSCEQGSRKRGRGRSRDLKLIQAYDNNGKRPLPIEFDVNDQHSYQPIGDNDSLFIRFIGNWIGNNIRMCYVSWDSVPKNKKIGMIPWMQQYFDLTPHRTGPHWDQISKGIERLCRDRYKDRKAKQKKHFMDNGGYDDVENARKHPPASVKRDFWDETIDHFLDPKYRNRAKKCKNRAKA
ncbi:LOW QUALITY PROTEIN: hypothetical protein OSB04_019722 [Centaurea solstitialis]|uniref:Transposase n=1 Tax=Centaurea solstitialis TaxID=347529 RepID=A0AA38SSI5_9ASTR|nr:LOW QUALITY PROTEIN: hypothetical protein OSB04_019722 [Centaurea solstitialis]